MRLDIFSLFPEAFDWLQAQRPVQNALREILGHYPGLQSEVVTFLGDRISESISGETADIAIKVFGENLDTLDTLGRRITQALRGTDGIADLQFKLQSGTPTFSLEIDRAALAASGLKLSDVLEAVETNYAGMRVGQTYAGIRSVNVVMLLAPDQRSRPELLPALMIAGPFGPVPLSQVARVAPSQSRFRVTHDGGQRYVSFVSDETAEAIVAELRAVGVGAEVAREPSSTTSDRLFKSGPGKAISSAMRFLSRTT